MEAYQNFDIPIHVCKHIVQAQCAIYVEYIKYKLLFYTFIKILTVSI